MGGHQADGAYWVGFDGAWTSSRYYLKDGLRPQWLGQINAMRAAQSSKPYQLHYERAAGGSGQGPIKASLETTIGHRDALLTPYADQYTLDVVEAAISAHGLGQDHIPDTLWVGLSTLDRAGHRTVSNTAMMEALFVHADRSLARLLNHIEHVIPGGLDQVLVTVTGARGMGTEATPAGESGGITAGENDAQIRARIEARMGSLFGRPGGGQTWFVGFENLNVYINRRLAAVRAIPLRRLEAAAAELLTEERGVALAATRHQILAGVLPPGRWGQQLKNQFVTGRSGDIIGIPAPVVLPDQKTVGHDTGYTYDRQVPLIISGPGIRRGRYHQVINIIDLVPTLASALGTIHPTIAEGRVLQEILNR